MKSARNIGIAKYLVFTILTAVTFAGRFGRVDAMEFMSCMKLHTCPRRPIVPFRMWTIGTNGDTRWMSSNSAIVRELSSGGISLCWIPPSSYQMGSIAFFVPYDSLVIFERHFAHRDSRTVTEVFMLHSKQLEHVEWWMFIILYSKRYTSSNTFCSKYGARRKASLSKA